MKDFAARLLKFVAQPGFAAACLFLFSIMAFSESKVSREKHYLNLTVGVNEDIKADYLPASAKLKGDYKRLAEVKILNETKSLRFTPKGEGTGVLTVIDSKGRVIMEYYLRISKSNLSKVAREIRALLADIEGIEVKIINDKVIVDGQVLLPADMNRIFSVVSQYKEATSLVIISPAAQRKIAEIIAREINDPQVSVRAVNDKFILDGIVGDIATKQRAEIIAKTYVPDVVTKAGEGAGLIKKQRADVVINLIQVQAPPAPEPGKIIQIVVHYVELQKDYTKGFRFQWMPTLSDDTGIGFGNTQGTQDGRSVTNSSNFVASITGTVTNLLPKLNWAKEHGHARVLESQSMIVQDGQQGTIQSVTRIPYQIIGPGNQPSTQFEETGISTKVKPTIISPNSDSMNLTINFSIKALVGSSAAGPLVSNNAVDTSITVRSGESAAIGGLVSNSSGTDYNKLPKDANSNPIISLYASKTFRRNQSQFVVFVTPIIKSSASAGSDKIKSKFRLRD